MISIKTKEEIEIMSEGSKILAGIIKELEKSVRPGITTLELDRISQSLILNAGGECSFLGYTGYPFCLCTSVNEQIVHAIPSKRKLKEGDIISLDLGIKYKGFHSDMAKTFPVGKVLPEIKKLIDVTKKALEAGIEKVKPGNKIGDISKAIQKYVESRGFSVVRELCGHGIGREIHEDPEILNSVSMSRETADKVKYFGDGQVLLEPGMVICLEPMVTMGDWRIKKSADGFGFETRDGSLSCHFEHTVAVLEKGHKILTLE